MAFSGKRHCVIMLEVMNLATMSDKKRPKPYIRTEHAKEFHYHMIDSL